MPIGLKYSEVDKMGFELKQKGEFEYIDEGEGEVLLLLHGLFGALSNWDDVVNKFSQNYRVVIPLLPIYSMPLKKAGIKGITAFVERFVEDQAFQDFTVIGNSLGGHIGLEYTINNADKVKGLILTGSSGLYEDTMGGSFPKRGDYNFVKEKVAYTFYDPAIATKDLVDYVFEVTTSNMKCLRIIAIARSAQTHNMADDLHQIKAPTLLIWGLNDTITPPFVGHEFNRLIKGSELAFIDNCCHAPMMEVPSRFNELVENFLTKHKL